MNDLFKFMLDGYPILLFTKLFLGAVAVFFAILVWGRTRRMSMIFFIFGIFLMYISILHDTLQYFGFIDTKFLNMRTVPTVSLIFESTPILCFIASFCAFLREKLF